MLTNLLIVCLLIWVPVLLYQINQRGLVLLLIWLFIAPVATNLVQGRSNPFFTTPQVRQERMELAARAQIYNRKFGSSGTTITPTDLLDPTRILLGAFVLVFLLNAVLQKKPLVPLDRTEKWMSIFSLVLVANVLLQTTRLGFGLRTAADAFIVPFLGYYVARRLVTSEDRLRKLMSVLGYVGCYAVGIGLIERLAHQGVTYRLKGPFGSGQALLVVITVTFFCVLLESVCIEDAPGKRGALPRGIRWFVLFGTPVITLLTWSRGNWVGFLSSVWAFLFLGRRFITPAWKLRTIGVVLTVIPIIGISALVLEQVEVIEGQQAIAGRVGRVETVNYRFKRWEIALYQGFQHPIFGVGLDNSRQVFAREAGGGASGAHNSFLSFFAELGAIGLLAYLAIVASIIRMGLRLYWMGSHARDRWLGVTIISVVVAGHVQALFANTLQLTEVSHVYVYVFIGGIAGLFTKHKLVLNPSSSTQGGTLR